MDKPAVSRDERWFDRFFRHFYGRHPVDATFIGEVGFDDRLPDLSEHALGDERRETESLLVEAEALEASSDAAPQPSGASGALDLRLATGFLRIRLWELGSEHFERGNPSLYTGEAVFGPMSILLTGATGPEGEAAPDGEALEALRSRLAGVPGLLAQARENVRDAPHDWTLRAMRECDGGLAFTRDGLPLVSPALEAEAEVAARAFAEHRAHLEGTLAARSRERVACGAQALDLYLREGHALRRSAEGMAEYARAQMSETKAYLEAHASDFDAADPDEAVSRLSDLGPSDAEEYYARYRTCWEEVRRLADERELLTWPDFPIRYVPRPAWARAAAPDLYFLFYRSPRAFRRRTVHDYLVTPIDDDMPPEERSRLLRANNDSVIKLNHVIHHGGIGHHVQNWHAFRAPSRIGRIAAVDGASRIAMFCGGTMAEGWACYATDLVAEAGGLTPLEQYAEHHGRIRMCARAVVDVELHSGRMSLGEATSFYRERAGMSESAARAEAVKNSMFPGAALMYLAGTDAIHELRAELMRRQGDAFTLRAFHDAFLSYGSVPVRLIADEMLRRAGLGQPLGAHDVPDEGAARMRSGDS